MRKGEQIIFNFITKRFGFLKHIPLAAAVFDSMQKVYTQIFDPDVIRVIDAVETEISKWPDVGLTLHKYGGTQFNFMGKELGHIHGNGLVDILLDLSTKNELIKTCMVQEHHIFKGTGWISFYISVEKDKAQVIKLFQLALHIRQSRKML